MKRAKINDTCTNETGQQFMYQWMFQDIYIYILGAVSIYIYIYIYIHTLYTHMPILRDGPQSIRFHTLTCPNSHFGINDCTLRIYIYIYMIYMIRIYIYIY